jgi:hypothetical protein
MSSDIDDEDDEPPISHAIADGWAEFAKKVLPSVAGTHDAPARVAFYFGAIYMLGIVNEVVAHGSAEAAALALDTLNAELDQFLKAHAMVIQ